MKFQFLWICTLLIGVLVSVPNAFAQDDDEDSEAVRIVILKVPGGGTKILKKEVDGLAEFDIRDQKWFLKQVKKRGMRPKRIMSRPKDVVWVMEGSEIAYILAIVPKSGSKDKYEGRIIDETGKPARTFELDRTKKGLSSAGAKVVRTEFSELLGFDEPVEVEEVEEDPEPVDTDVIVEKAIQKKEDDDVKSREDWLWLDASGKLMKREISFVGSSGAAVTYNSTFYPGIGVHAEAYVGAFFSAEAVNIGVLADFRMGFDSVQFRDEDDSRQDAPISHIEVEGGLIYRLDEPLSSSGETTSLKLRLKFTGLHIRYGVDSRALVPMDLTVFNIGGTIAYPVLVENFAVTGGLSFVPFGFFGGGADVFGRSALIYGFSTRIGILYGFTESLAFSAGYGFRLLRSSFSGNGDSDFEDTQGFDLNQTLEAGVVLQF